MKIKIILLLLPLFFIYFSCQNEKDQDESKFLFQGKINYSLSNDEEVFLDSIQRFAFFYFLGERNPANGLVKDRTAEWSASSIAAVGFAIPSYAIAAERN
ncbi:MAG: hypothetical protein LDL01_04790, partial [Ignavibacterium sp.]|nr:hypothetical protein [Ignavibacterium sp.]